MTTSATSWRVEGKSGVLLCNSVCITGYNKTNPLYMHVCTLRHSCHKSWFNRSLSECLDTCSPWDLWGTLVVWLVMCCHILIRQILTVVNPEPGLGILTLLYSSCGCSGLALTTRWRQIFKSLHHIFQVN